MTSRYERHHNPQPGKPRPTTDEILISVVDVLETAELGLADLTGDDPRRRLPGLRNLIVWGRSVTNVLQKLRTPVGKAFDEWYTPFQAEMQRDDLMKYFYRLRSEILKEGKTPNIGTHVRIKYLNTNELQPLMENPPPGAEGFFIGDRLGGSGWNIKLPDGTEESYYVALPDHLDVDISLHVEKPPTSHGGRPIVDTSIEAVATHYIEYLRRLVQGAKQTFGS